MYSVRPFMRMNSDSSQAIRRFMQAVAGQGLSVREIDLLAQGYFRGSASLREAIDNGKLHWSLEQMKRVPDAGEGCNQFELLLLKDLQMLDKYLRRVMAKCEDRRLKSRAFHAQANLLTGGLLGQLEVFEKTMKALHDRSGDT
jgi:hypothetical protein